MSINPTYRRLQLLVAFLTITFVGYGQEQSIYQQYGIYRNPVMVMLNQFSLTLDFGYGAANYKHHFQGNLLYQDFENLFILPKSGEGGLPDIISGYEHWLNNPVPGQQVQRIEYFDVPYDRLPDPVFNPRLSPNRIMIDGDTTELMYKGIGHTIPVNFSIHHDFEKIRVGIGGGWDKQWVKQLKPTLYEDQLRVYLPDFKSTHFWRLYGTLGYRLYEMGDYRMVGEARVGYLWHGKQFNKELLRRNISVNLGLTFERHLSEYMRIIVRPSYDIKSYIINLPAAPLIPAGSVRHADGGFFMTFGLSINIPEVPRSPLGADKVQLKHIIVDPVSGKLMEVRGQPMWKKQNPKVGENHRKMFRDKRRNKKKLNPY
ncbi:MAG: hypothetical protein JXQ90_03925 [Cyclobacteriaceae bacterium]